MRWTELLHLPASGDMELELPMLPLVPIVCFCQPNRVTGKRSNAEINGVLRFASDYTGITG